MTWILRDERPSEIPTINKIAVAAFATKAYGDGTEGDLIDSLRRDGDLSLSLVADLNGVVVGRVSMSPATVGKADGWYGLGPVAVDTDHFKQGIGSTLIRTALGRVAEQGAAGVVLVGDPNYYSRFGFVKGGSVQYLNIEAKNVMVRTLNGPTATGVITFAPALHGA